MIINELIEKYQDETIYFVKFNKGFATFESEEIKVVFAVDNKAPLYYNHNLSIISCIHDVVEFEIKSIK